MGGKWSVIEKNIGFLNTNREGHTETLMTHCSLVHIVR